MQFNTVKCKKNSPYFYQLDLNGVILQIVESNPHFGIFLTAQDLTWRNQIIIYEIKKIYKPSAGCVPL